MFRLRFAGLFDRSASNHLLDDIREYSVLPEQYGGIELRRAKALEIGFGARPHRLFALSSIGVDIQGVDLDVPMVRGLPRELLQMYRQSGAERVMKSLIRFYLFDLWERRQLASALAKIGVSFKIDTRRLRVCDAVSLDLEDASLDFIVSEDVFEHIPFEGLCELVPKMAHWLRPNGLALIRPCIFTGISGGHLSEWFPAVADNLTLPRRSEPWEHLRHKRFKPNTFLNGASRHDYRQLFVRHFDILEERVKLPWLGRSFFTPDVAHELSPHFPEDELFSNQVLFILRPRHGPAM
jgi:hypothetical protein